MATLEQRLADIDRRLREMQSELATEDVADTAAQDSPPAPPRGQRSGPLAEILRRGVRRGSEPQPEADHADAHRGEAREPEAELAARLLAATRELLEGYERVLSRGRSTEVAISAGPFSSTAALRDFERTLGSLPGVRDVAVRGYEGPDRAIIEVQLS
jgi:hypothetical protein